LPVLSMVQADSGRTTLFYPPIPQLFMSGVEIAVIGETPTSKSTLESVESIPSVEHSKCAGPIYLGPANYHGGIGMKTVYKTFYAGVLSISLLAPLAFVPSVAYGQRSEYDRRQQTKNEWRNIAIGSGVLALLGLINDDKTLMFAGTVGALYSAHRYEQDRKSQNRLNRFRAQVFSRSSFTRDGYRYVRKTKWKNGKKYYYFVKTRIR
jgi:hypothetical protein